MSKGHHNLIMGKNTIRELLFYKPERIKTVYTTKEGDDDLIKLFLEKGIEIKYLNKQSLTNLVDSDSHQGFVAKVTRKQELDLREFLRSRDEEQPSLILMLDSINDPQNLGSILRASECFGVDAVIWSKNRGVDLTPVVSKVSVGASELLTTIKVSNLADAVRKLKEEGYEVITAEVGTGAKNINQVTFSDKLVLIMGSEGKGVQPLLGKLADLKVYIPMHGKIDSLNVSQATAVILSKIRLSAI